MKITKELLLSGKNQPCGRSLKVFQETFPDGMEVTHENIRVAQEKDLRTEWFVPFRAPEQLQTLVSDILSLPTRIVSKITLKHREDYEREEKRLIELRDSGTIDSETLYRRVKIASDRLAESLSKNVEMHRRVIGFVDVEMINGYMNEDGTAKDVKEIVITESDLVSEKPYACVGHLDIFKKHFPDGFTLNEENVKLAERIGLDIDWFIDWKLPPEQTKAICQYGRLVRALKNVLLDLCHRDKTLAISLEESVYNASRSVAKSEDEYELCYNRYMKSVESICQEYSDNAYQIGCDEEKSVWLFALRMINAYGLLK